MPIAYKDVKAIPKEDLQRLFLSVEWSSGHYPEKLAAAIAGSDTVFTAWDGGRLIGLVNALDDGAMTAYVHYALVHPDYQGGGVGKKLMALLRGKYEDYLRIVLIAYDDSVEFYRRCGYDLCEADKKPMQLTTLWT